MTNDEKIEEQIKNDISKRNEPDILLKIHALYFPWVRILSLQELIPVLHRIYDYFSLEEFEQLLNEHDYSISDLIYSSIADDKEILKLANQYIARKVEGWLEEVRERKN